MQHNDWHYKIYAGDVEYKYISILQNAFQKNIFIPSMLVNA